jgi:hypothetical protein
MKLRVYDLQFAPVFAIDFDFPSARRLPLSPQPSPLHFISFQIFFVLFDLHFHPLNVRGKVFFLFFFCLFSFPLRAPQTPRRAAPPTLLSSGPFFRHKNKEQEKERKNSSSSCKLMLMETHKKEDDGGEGNGRGV